MRRKERAEYVDQRLQQLYPNPPIPLDHTDAYTLLVAVLLSAQCTDARVNTVTPALWQLADNAYDMSAMSVEEVNRIVRPCGLAPRKAKAIVGLSKILVNEHDGEVPDSLVELERLPGVGHKTASVVMAQAFGVPSFPVDTHIHRLAKRWGLSDGSSVVKTERDLIALFPKERRNALHLQIIYYGREHCPARKCFGLECEICRHLYPRRRTAVK